MLEIICTASLALSMTVCQNSEIIDSTGINSLETPSIIQVNTSDQQEYLAKGKPYKSRYRHEADRDIHELRHRRRDHRDHHDRNSRHHRHREEHYNRDRGRIYRDPYRRGREIDYDHDQYDRYYRHRYNRDRYYRRGR